MRFRNFFWTTVISIFICVIILIFFILSIIISANIKNPITTSNTHDKCVFEAAIFYNGTCLKNGLQKQAILVNIRHVRTGTIFKCFKSDLDSKTGCTQNIDIDKSVNYCEEQINFNNLIHDCYLVFIDKNGNKINNQIDHSENYGIKLGSSFILNNTFYYILSICLCTVVSLLVILFIFIMIIPENSM